MFLVLAFFCSFVAPMPPLATFIVKPYAVEGSKMPSTSSIILELYVDLRAFITLSSYAYM